MREATPPGAILRNDIVDRAALSPWGRGPVTLLGDAAHPTTPNYGQGACMAIEDATFLARDLRHAAPGDLPGALRRYEDRRRRDTTWIVRASWWPGWVGQWENSLAMAVRDAVTAPGVTHAPTMRQIQGMLSREPPEI